MNDFDPSKIKSFRFINWEFDEEKYAVSLKYAFDNVYFFTEEFVFPRPSKPLDDKRREAFDGCLQNLFLVAGISYYKAAVPQNIEIENTFISPETAKFFDKLYLLGLAEFAYQNKINLQNYIHFPYVNEPFPSGSEIELSNCIAIPVGGGKDSIVTIEALSNLSTPRTLISVGSASSIEKTAEIAGLSHIKIMRKISPLLLELNKKGALNGHIPISAIISFAITAAAVLYDFNCIAMSNERSANIGNLWNDGFEINHQYSKSLEFEKDMAEYTNRHILKNLRYFSFLRPLSELAISEIFCSHCEKYHEIFASCSAAFRIVDASNTRWCLKCPKCRFVFAMLAPFIKKDKLVAMFGRNLFAEQAQIPGFKEIIGYGKHKPFSCIGEFEEAIAAFIFVSERIEWEDDAMIKYFKKDVFPKLTLPENYIENALHFSGNHFLKNEEKDLLLSMCEKCKK